jgi:hypothetical protein
MESIDRLFAILGSDQPGDLIARITVAPWTWFLLQASVDECWYFASGFTREERGERAIGIRIIVDETQEEAFRLWDRTGHLLEAILEE